MYGGKISIGDRGLSPPGQGDEEWLLTNESGPVWGHWGGCAVCGCEKQQEVWDEVDGSSLWLFGG